MLISIGLPVYKTQYLAQAIQSILDQTYTEFELIIVNDASPDPVDDIIMGFNDSRIKYFTNEINLGRDDLAACWNKSLDKASGEYFVLASDDDYYEPTFLEKMISKALQFPDIDIFHCRLRIINDNGETLDITETCYEREDILDHIWHRLVKNRNQMIIEFMYKTKKLNQTGGFYSMPAGWGSDDITCFIMAKENGIVFINEILCNWRKSGSNISTSHNFYYQKMMAIIKYKVWLKDFLSDIESYNPNDIFLAEINKKANNELDIRLSEMAALFIAHSPFRKVLKNSLICKKRFKVKIISILGLALESFGRKIKNKY